MNDLSSIGKEPTAIKIPVSKPPLDNSSPTKLKTCYMTGKAPWGFRITSTSSSGITPGILSLSNLVVVKVIFFQMEINIESNYFNLFFFCVLLKGSRKK